MKYVIMTSQATAPATNITNLKVSDLKELIKVPNATLSINDSIAKAMQAYKIFNNPYMVMKDEEDKVVGILREDTVLEYCYELLQRTTGSTNSRYELAYHYLSDFVQNTSPVLALDDSLNQVIDYVLNTRFNLFPVADADGKLVGTIGCRDLLEGHDTGIIEINKIK